MYTLHIKYIVFHWYNNLFFKPPTHSTLLKGTIPGSPSTQADQKLVFQNLLLEDQAKPFEVLCEFEYIIQCLGAAFFPKKKPKKQRTNMTYDMPLEKLGARSRVPSKKERLLKKTSIHHIFFTTFSLWGKLIWTLFLVGFKILWKKPSESRHVFSWLTKYRATLGP